MDGRNQGRQRAGRMNVKVRAVPSLRNNGAVEGAEASSWSRGALRNERTLQVEGGVPAGSGPGGCIPDTGCLSSSSSLFYSLPSFSFPGISLSLLSSALSSELLFSLKRSLELGVSLDLNFFIDLFNYHNTFKSKYIECFAIFMPKQQHKP